MIKNTPRIKLKGFSRVFVTLRNKVPDVPEVLRIMKFSTTVKILKNLEASLHSMPETGGFSA